MLMTGYLIQHLLVFVVVYADFTYSHVDYYITPSSNEDVCPKQPCLSLLQLTANSSRYLGNETNVSLFFLPGNHSLKEELSLSHVDNFSMTKDIGGDGTVFVECGSPSGRFNISEMTFVTIKDLHFIGCGSNRVSQVEEFIVEDTMFQGVEGKGTELVLSNVTTAYITGSIFHSNVFINGYHDTEFTNISPVPAGGGALYIIFSTVSIVSSKFTNNRVTVGIENTGGGALYMAFSNIVIVNSTFTLNTAVNGGALFAHNSSLQIVKSNYSYNTASYGGVMDTLNSTVNITNSNFSNNAAGVYGGVMIAYRYHNSFSISGTTFANNRAGHDGGVMDTRASLFIITDSTFINNRAQRTGGVMSTSYYDSFNISGTTFANNSAGYDGGVMDTHDSLFTIIDSTFINNAAQSIGGVMRTYSSSFNITASTFTGNVAHLSGGVIESNSGSSFNITDSTFSDNAANLLGGVISSYYSLFSINRNNFTHNNATFGGVILLSYGDPTMTTFNQSIDIINSMFINNSAAARGFIVCFECSTHIANSTFEHNSGSLYIFNGNLTLSGYTIFENCSEPLENSQSQEGGAITSFLSTVTFTGMSSLSNNHAQQGGAILAVESTIIMYGDTIIANNVATKNMTNGSGGGISLQQSKLEIKGKCSISDNQAVRGGGIHVSGSTIAIHRPGTLHFINNTAENGGGLYLELNPKVYTYYISNKEIIVFKDNHAIYGGAVYIADDTNPGACLSSNGECVIQTLILDPLNRMQNTVNTMLFSGNNASQGTNIFGGLLDRCIPNLGPLAELYLMLDSSDNNYLDSISDVIALDTISSLPVQVCFCNDESEPDCSYQPPTIKVKKGEAFNVLLVAVDQVNRSIDANINIQLSREGGLSEGQQIQEVGSNCTNLPFNVVSPHDSEILSLFADGPCTNSILSTRYLDIQFTDCTCPIGFESSENRIRCECTCDSKLTLHVNITTCNPTTGSFVKAANSNSWIAPINNTVYIIHPYCPFDYCKSENVIMNLNLPNETDAQCAYDRSGVLCGACQEHLSLSLGSSRCLPCPSHWPALLVGILLVAIIAGILLVTALLALNMTVAVGMISGFIFYANIVAANSAVFFPSSEPDFPTVFIAWLNLDIGIDVCFFDGLDAYYKTWLQLAFPAYIILLVILIIIVSEYSPRFAGLIGKKDPIATLATLILLSYAKLLSVSITALLPATIVYPNKTQKTVWLPDGNMQYFLGKHSALVIVAIIIILIGISYTSLLFLWQWIVCAPKWKIFKWTRNTKLSAFIFVHHAPYNAKYRYWTGLLLLVRVVLFTTALGTKSIEPQVSLLMTIILVGGLLSLKTAVTVYKSVLVNVVETILCLNLLAFATFSFFRFKTDMEKQKVVAYISTAITLILLIGAIIYHIFLLVKKDKHPKEEDGIPLAPVQPANAEITHTVVEIPKPCDESPPPQANSNEVTVTY